MMNRFYSSLAEFRTLFQEGIPILNYHMIAALPFDRKLKGLYAPPKAFANQLKELRRAGFSSTRLEGILGAKNNGGKNFVLAFDDGFASVFDHALKILSEYQCKAIQFLVPHLIGKTNEWDLVLGQKQLALMDQGRIQTWLKEGHAIGSHTLTHPYLTRLTEEKAREEISASRKWLEDAFGAPVEHFCYPYGDFNEKIKEWVREAGYRTACTVNFGVNTTATDPFELKRIKGRHPTRKLKIFLTRLFEAQRSPLRK